MKKSALPFVFACLLVPTVSAQTAVDFTHDGDVQVEFDTAQTDDEVALHRQLQDLRTALVARGYAGASVDTLEFRGDTLRIHLHVGELYEWAVLDGGNVPPEVLARVRYRAHLFQGRPLNPVQLSKLMDDVLDRMLSTGYPFATIRLDSLELRENKLSAALDLERNVFTVIDSLIIKGEFDTERQFLQSHLGLKPGMPYDETLLQKIPARIRELPFVEAIRPYEIGMREGKADVYLYLKKKKASHFDGILGVLPDEETGEVIITGDVTLNLMNALKRGETIALRVQRLETRTQELDVNFVYPFLFGSPLGVDLKMNLYRRDTLYTRTKFHAGLDYYFLGNDKVTLFVERSISSVISEEAFEQGLHANSESFLVGLGTSMRDLDYRFNPRRGYYVNATFATGRKTVDESPGVGQDGQIGVKTTDDLYNADVEAGKFFALGRRSTVLGRLKGGLYLSDQMFRNEAYRIGGLKSLRGFDEQSIFATRYLVGTIEYRFILEENSNFFVFFDQGYYEDRLKSGTTIDNPYGFGAGVNFETGPGVFSLSYALGKQFDNRISLKAGKIHFGFISFF